MTTEWRCMKCGKLLAELSNSRIHIKFARGHQCVVGFPATSVCRGCDTVNELDEPRRDFTTTD